MDYLEAKKAFDKQHSKLSLPEDCSDGGADFNPITQYSWTFTWILEFRDDKYVRIWEQHAKVAGLQLSRRLKYAFHYGPIAARDTERKIQRASRDPVVLRIDNDRGVPHIHLNAPEPHIQQAQLSGLQLDTVDKFQFLQKVLTHRSSGKPIDDVFGIKVK